MNAARPAPARDGRAFVDALHERRPGYLPEWQPGTSGPDVAITEILGRYLAAIAGRLDQVPDKLQLVLLDQLGIGLIPAQAARAPVVFTMSPGAADGRVPAGTRLAAKAPEPPTNAPDDGTGDGPATTPPGPILFEVERSAGIASAARVELRGGWPGRDQSTDHVPAPNPGRPRHPWALSELQDVPHHLYLAHRTLLALSGTCHVTVTAELSQGCSERLDTTWEYWDGKTWRPFRNTIADCDRLAAATEDSTAGFQRSGAIHLLTECAETKPTTVDGVESCWVRGRLTEPLVPDPAQLLPEIEQLQLSTIITCDVGAAPTGDGEPAVIAGGLLPDTAIVDGSTADLTKPFYPFGQQPQPGSVFYFSSDEVFSKPGANVQVCFVRTPTPQDQLAADATDELEHRVAWEYWNGREWATVPGMGEQLDSAPADLNPSGDEDVATVLLTVPPDIEATTVADVEARWMRVRLVRGGYGFTKTVSWTDTGPNPDVTNSFTYVVSRPPALSALKLGYSWTYGPFVPERVLTYNDFQYEDHTDEAIWPGKVFRPFDPPADVTPALYFGFDKPLPVDQLGIYFDIQEVRGDTLGPALRWEHWDGGSWQEVTADDQTRRLRLPGVVGLIGPGDSRPLARFGTSRWWLRARLAEDGPPGSPGILGVFLNAVWAAQQETVLDDPIGASSGLPSQVFALRRAPILPGEQIEVRELHGQRADVEWRIVARELFPDDARVVDELDALLHREGTTTDVQWGPLRLRRDRDKHVIEVWVLWQGVEHFLRSGANDRHYVLEGSLGRLRFGDGTEGKIPPAAAAISARRYRVGGGSLGNVPAGAIAQLQGSIGGVASVRNPSAATGGADAESLQALRARGPSAVRHCGRALTARDVETIAREASADVAMVQVLPARSADGRHQAGHVTIVVVPASPEPRPWPSFGLRERVRTYVEAHADAAVAGLHRIDVVGPAYVEIDVDAVLVPTDATEAGAVERRARAAVGRLLHPVYGGPTGGGWRPGRPVFLSDVAAVLERVDGVDHVEQLAISVAGRIAGQRIDIGRDRTVVAGHIRLVLRRAT